LSDLNYELGKAKESLVCESGNYLGNLKTDASMVTNIIKTESNRLNETYFDGKIKLPRFQKSFSLPHFEMPILHDYQRTLILDTEKEETKTKKVFDKVSVDTFKFDKVEEEEVVSKNTSYHMQMCFIDDEDDDNNEDESDDDLLFPTSNRNSLDYFVDVEFEDVKPKMTVKQTIQNAKEIKLRYLQSKLRSNLTFCKENALKKSLVLKKKLIDENPLSKLMGIQKDNWELLEEYETDVLKGTIKALKAKISEYNDELVNLLEEKDTLEQHREEKIVDIKDLATIL